MLPDGEEGELVFTTLTKEALPMIRYRTRDLTRLLPPTARSMRRMGKIIGRSDDMLIIRGVNVFPTQIEEIVLEHADCSRPVPARGQPRGPPGRGGGAVRGAARAATGREAAIATDRATELQHHIKTLCRHQHARCTCVPPRLDRAHARSARRRRVIDQRPKG